MGRTRAGRWLARMVTRLITVVGCTDDGGVEGNPDVPTTTAASSETADASTPAARLRLRLERQFAAFGYITVESTRVARNQRQQADAIVRRAIDEVVATTASVYDAGAAALLEGDLTAWSEEIRAYPGTKKARRGAARTRLDSIAADVAEFMASTTRGGMEGEGTAVLIRGPLRETANAIDAFDVRNFDRSNCSPPFSSS